jgi:hypothetical protein
VHVRAGPSAHLGRDLCERLLVLPHRDRVLQHEDRPRRQHARKPDLDLPDKASRYIRVAERRGPAARGIVRERDGRSRY